nr:hypothetical protein [Tanacetum cinerariifolium]
MADQRTMAQLLRASTEVYAEAIVVPPILAEHFKLKQSLINMMTSDQFFGLEKDNPHDHIPDQDSLNSTAGDNLLERRSQDVLTIIENKSKVCNSQNKSIVSQVKSSDANSSFSSEIANLTQAVNQQTSAVTTAVTAILKQFQATPPPASVKAVEEICFTCRGAHLYYQCLAADGNTFLEFWDNIQGYVSAAAVNYNQCNFVVPLSELEKIKMMNEINIKAMETQINNVKNELRNEMKTSIQASMSNQTNETKNMMASFFQMNTASTSGSGPLHSNTIANPKGELKSITTRSGLVLDRPSIPMSPPFINPEEDERAEETLTNPELAEYTIKEKLLELANTPLIENCSAVILNMLSKKLGDPRKFLISYDFSELKYKALADLEVINPFSGNTTSSSPDHLLEEFADELALITFPSRNDDLPFDIESDLREIEYLLNHDPTKEMGSYLEDLVDECNLADPNNNLVDTIPEMFTDEHTLDYSSPPLYDDVDDDLVELESDNDDIYDDPFNSKEDKIKESKLLIDELDPLDQDKVFNLGILIHENLDEVTNQVTPDNNVKKISISNASLILEDFNPLLYELPFDKEVPGSETLLSFSSKNEEKVFIPGILTSKGVHTYLLLKLSHWGPKAFKVIKIFESSMEILPCFYGEDIHILNVSCLHFYPP